ncbi:MAG: glycosyltransferase, partial [Calditrichaeota bacterium]|nr:glycosyltransferase [Calditrichota bacterium]
MVSTDGHARFLPECLDSLPGACADLPFRVILVDNDGDSLSCQIARRYESTLNLKCLAQERPKGFAANVNDALEWVAEPYVLLLNVDTVLPAGAVRETVRVMERNPGVGALTVRMRGKDGRLQASGRAFPYPTVLLYDQLGLSRLFPRS